MARSDEPKIIFSMLGVSKKIERKEILRDISLSFYYGAKIGVLGLNGSGNPRCSAFSPVATPRSTAASTSSSGYAIGFLEQEPQLTAGLDRARVRRGRSETSHRSHGRLRRDLGRTRRGRNRCAKRCDLDEAGANCRKKIDALGAWDVTPQVEMAMDALRCPPGDQIVDNLSGGERRRVALARLLLKKPHDSPPRRADQSS